MVRNTKNIFVSCVIAITFFTFSGVAFASGTETNISPDEALAKLVEGNKRFIEGTQTQKDVGQTRRTELETGQHPFAVILSCSDSRVPPEHIFDQGLGDIFVVRVAGNIADSVELGSIEYAVEHLGAPLILVLGHQSCGAVKATLDGGKPEGNIASIVRKIKPSVKKAKAIVKEKDKVLDAAILENTKETAQTLVQKSAIIRHLVHKKRLKIAAGVYSLAAGKVELVDASEAESPVRKHEAKKQKTHSGEEHAHAAH